MKTELKEFLQKYKPQGVKRALQSKPEYMEFVEHQYPGVDLVEAIYLILHDIDAPRASCGNLAKFEGAVKGYSEYCTLPKFGPQRCQCCYDKLSAKKKSTNIDKYGTEFAAQSKSVRDKIENTNMERYGTLTPAQNEEVKNKSKTTTMERYGVEHTSQLKSNQEKRANTMLEKYGVHNSLLLTKKGLGERYSDFSSKHFNAGFTLLSTPEEYEHLGNKGILHWKCNTCSNEFHKVYQCLRCPVCEPYSASTEEIELAEFIESITGVPSIRNSRSIIQGKEINIFCPEKGIGIEFNGEYWHREEVRDEHYHQQKSVAMRNAGHRLITIYASDWRNRRELIKNRLLNIFGTSSVLYARKGNVRTVSGSEADAFMERNHIQGTCISSIQLGLYFGTELKALMTFGTPRFNKEYQYELIRYCSEGTVVGAAGKLIKHFEKHYTPESLLTYADMNWSTGDLYRTLGFDYLYDTKPGYSFYDRRTETFLSRYQCQKGRLAKKHGFSTDMTGPEMIAQLGYFKIWDCGNMVFCKKY